MLMTVWGAAMPAWADAVIAPNGTQQEIKQHRALVVHQDGSEVLIETLQVHNTSSRALWIKALPAQPEFIAAPATPFEELSANSTAHRPHNQAVRERAFGPSIVTVLNRRFFDKAPDTVPETEQANSTSTTISERVAFNGTIFTSTITGQYTLPDPMKGWLHSRGFVIDQGLLADLSTHMNRGAWVSLTIVDDRTPNTPGTKLFGPLSHSIRTDHAVFPSLRRSGQVVEKTEYELFVVGSGPLVPSAYATMWNEEPWVPAPVEQARFQTRYAKAIGPSSALRLDLEQRLNLKLPADAFLIRSRFRQGTEALGEIIFEPAKRFVEIPGEGAKGSGLDLFFCLLLGLTPLIYTPESWFLMWLRARSKSKAVNGKAPFGLSLWPLYALVVAGYWAITLTGPARLAATIPLVLAILLLVLPQSESTKPVRSKFSNKRPENPRS